MIKHSVKILANVYRSAEAPGGESAEKSALESGVPRKVRTNASVSAPPWNSYRREDQEHFFGAFLGTPFSAGTFLSTLLDTFSAWGFALISTFAKTISIVLVQ